MDSHAEAHLFVSAVRVLHHTNATPPTVEELSALLHISDESGHSICRKLEKKGIIYTLEDPFSVKVSVADYLAIEMLPKEAGEENSIADELQKFKAQKEEAGREIDEIKAEMEKKKKDMFSDIESKFKEEMEKYKK